MAIAVPLWILLILVTWAGIMTFFLFFRNYLPIPDRGHRCFGILPKAAPVLLQLTSDLVHLPERFSFRSGYTFQSLLWDNNTVFIWDIGTDAKAGLLPLNACSFVVDDPLKRALEASILLNKGGFPAEVHRDVNPELRDKLVVVSSPAFLGWVMVFRKHVFRMGKLKKVRLTYAVEVLS